MSDSEWFDKDDETLMKDLARTIEAKRIDSEEKPGESLDDYLRNLTLESSSNSNEDGREIAKRIKTLELRQISMMEPLDMFLHIETQGYDFYSDQIKPNDSQERVTLYIHILASICCLQVPGFHRAEMFWRNQCLKDHIRMLTEKLFCKRLKYVWKKEKELQTYLADVELLLIKSVGVVGMEGFLKDLLKDIETGDSEMVACEMFSREFMKILQNCAATDQQEKRAALDVLPSLEDISTKDSLNECLPMCSEKSVSQYLQHQMELIKRNFITPIQDCVQIIKHTKKPNKQLPPSSRLFENVLIVPNQKFMVAHRHELIFVDVLGLKREKKKNTSRLLEHVHHIKIGALLCFTTSKDFNNLILATVNYTSEESLQQGYIGIEITRIHNIGNIYNLPLIMLETPVFFEPSRNVFNCLKSCTITDFPMRKYLLQEDATNQPPAYLNDDTTYQCFDEKFQPMKDLPPNGKLKLNPSQLQAFSEALKREFVLIQGPPATGKTHLSVQIVKTLIENADTPIVLLTYTKKSLDKFLQKLSLSTEKIAKFGGRDRKDVVDNSEINPKLKRLYYLTNMEFRNSFRKLQHKFREFDDTKESYNDILQAESELAEISEKLNTLKVIFQYYAARNKTIIAMTTTCAAKMNFLLRLLKTKIVIFGEAACIPETHVLACLTPHTQHVIMVGDHQQMQPSTYDHQLDLDSDMNLSMFERLFDKQSHPIILKTQYRMHPKIADLLCNTIYKELETDASPLQYPGIRLMSTNLYFLTHQKPESRLENDSSLYNQYEITQVVQLALHLIQNALYDVQDIQILSPYVKQRNLIRKHLQEHSTLKRVQVSTVEGFHDRESDIIILSLVCSDSSSRMASHKQSICVALSRAKHAMYILGNLQMLSQSSEIWQTIESKLLLHNAVGEKFPMESDNIEDNSE